jgi:hypothetical protein
MDPAQIVVSHEQDHGGGMVFELLAKAVGQPGEPPRRHSQREVRSLHVAGRDVRRISDNTRAVHCYYYSRRISPRGVDSGLAYILLTIWP